MSGFSSRKGTQAYSKVKLKKPIGYATVRLITNSSRNYLATAFQI